MAMTVAARLLSGVILHRRPPVFASAFFFFNDTATTEIYTLSLHDALPISQSINNRMPSSTTSRHHSKKTQRSEEHTSELQSRLHLVCRLLLEKKKAAPRAPIPSSSPTMLSSSYASSRWSGATVKRDC